MKHVLVVEDDPTNALVFRTLIERRCGYRATVTDSPEEVLALARSGDVGLVVMDVSLGNSQYQGQGMSGVELCRLLKDDPSTRAIPVLLATAHAMRGDAERLLAESGADDYVAKPIVDHAAFVDLVRRVAGAEAA